jgi:Zn-finger nucleic acid-binding protein
MNDQGPYREIPRFLTCPRCGELLDRAFDDVLACMRCEGIFITPPTAGLAFEDPAWPADAAAMWWKSSLACPICAYHGAPTTMAAQSFEGTQIDRCATHGLWLDRGELNRLAHTTGNELGVLRRKLHGEADGAELDAKREAWRRDVEARRKAAEEHNERLAAERQRQILEADRRQAEARMMAEEERRYREALVAPMVVSRPPAPELAPRKPDPPRARVVSKADRQRRDDQRGEVVRSIGELETQLAELRRQVRAVESALSTQRARLRVLVDDDR